MISILSFHAASGNDYISSIGNKDSITVNSAHGWYKGRYIGTYDSHGHLKVWAENRFTKADTDDNHPNQYVSIIPDTYPTHQDVAQTKYMQTAHVSTYINAHGELGFADQKPVKEESNL